MLVFERWGEWVYLSREAVLPVVTALALAAIPPKQCAYLRSFPCGVVPRWAVFAGIGDVCTFMFVRKDRLCPGSDCVY